MADKPVFRPVGDYIWEAEPVGEMRVPARVLASRKLWDLIQRDNSLKQLCNVATLPGIVGYALAMPDIHEGYGFPIGGVAAFRVEDGIISPGGVGYDINCGVRVAVTHLTQKDLEGKVERLADVLFETVPTGVGAHGAIRKLSREELRQVVVRGARWAIEEGFGTEEDLRHTEENGCLAGADPDKISARAYERGADQLGTLGSGNHFAEVDFIDEVYDEAAAQRLGLFRGQVVYQIHCGSRGFGHQVCDDYLSVMYRAVQKYGIRLPDRQLVCAPLSSPEAQDYLAAMRGAANFAWCNRQIIMALMARAFQKALGVSPRELGVRLLYDVCHNIAKVEEHVVDGQRVKVCVHRKGATRAFPPGRPEIPSDYRDIGQPVLIPGDMGRYSYILLGKPKAMELTFGSSCHGAGRVMSRAQAKRLAAHRNIERELREVGIVVRGESRATIDEEMPEAYKDVSEVVEVVHQTGISTKLVRLKPICVIKG